MRVVSESVLAAALAALPGDEPRIVCSGNAAPPFMLLRLAERTLPSFRLFMLNAPGGIPTRPGIRLETPFVGAGMRDSPELDYIPSRLSLVPHLFVTSRPPDVVFVHTSPVFEGTLSLGVEVNIMPAAIEAVKARGGLVVAQVNRQMPYTFGDGVLGPDEVDLAVECDEPLPSPHERVIDEVSREIGERVAALIPYAATLQMGIGSMPDATLESLAGNQGLRIWSEMFSDGVLALERSGQLDPGEPITSSFCFGSPELYQWVHRNPRVRILRTEKTNAPGLIARLPRLTSINGALQVDLFAQANASRRPRSAGSRIYSGFGGQTDFIVGALHSPGGQAIIALPSWAPRADVSTVVPLVDGPVTSFQHSRIVSEQGDARIWGADQSAQAWGMIERVAHPKARDELREAAEEMHLLTG